MCSSDLDDDERRGERIPPPGEGRHPPAPTRLLFSRGPAPDQLEYKDYIFRYATIPVNRKQCLKAVEKALSDFSPSIMIYTSLAGGRSAIAVERAALNVTDFPIPDNEGYVSLNEAIDPEGPAAYFSTLPIRAIVKKIREAGVPYSDRKSVV